MSEEEINLADSQSMFLNGILVATGRTTQDYSENNALYIGYDYQDARDGHGSPEWWYLHFTFILPQLLDPMHDVGKEEDDD